MGEVTLPPSLCDRCYAPGQCCKRLHLSTMDGEAVTVWARDRLQGKPFRDRDLPFEPLELLWSGPSPDSGEVYEEWSWSCPRLQGDGRCGDYENRPELCRKFEPASNGLCVHFGGAEAGTD